MIWVLFVQAFFSPSFFFWLPASSPMTGELPRCPHGTAFSKYSFRSGKRVFPSQSVLQIRSSSHLKTEPGYYVPSTPRESPIFQASSRFPPLSFQFFTDGLVVSDVLRSAFKGSIGLFPRPLSVGLPTACLLPKFKTCRPLVISGLPPSQIGR